MKLTIRLSDLHDVKRLVDITSRYDEEISLIGGGHTVDAKSVLGVFTIDLTQPLELVCDMEDEALLRDLKPFIAA
jgi:phosphotransferase system HPr-like phosphotransfer protein